uniref:Uncharacterized protein n=1 Tax=Romanomermis culicivorax TaxID=13658 RepID=A0A915K1U9_ROMCU
MSTKTHNEALEGQLFTQTTAAAINMIKVVSFIASIIKAKKVFGGLGACQLSKQLVKKAQELEKYHNLRRPAQCM